MSLNFGKNFPGEGATIASQNVKNFATQQKKNSPVCEKYDEIIEIFASVNRPLEILGNDLTKGLFSKR